MNSIKTFFKDYWITLLIVLGMCLAYYVISQNGLISPLMFPKVGLIWKVFLENRNVQLTNVFAYFTCSFDFAYLDFGSWHRAFHGN